MSNALGVIAWAAGLGDNCPSVTTIQDALSAHAPPPLPPLPDGVVWDASNTGAVNFTNAADPAKRAHPYFWITASASVAKGTPQYAEIVYNCTTLDRMIQWGWLPTSWASVVPTLDLMTGLPTYQPGPALSPPGTTIPTRCATLEQALSFVDNGH